MRVITLTLVTLLVGLGLAACTTASGPTTTPAESQPVGGGEGTGIVVSDVWARTSPLDAANGAAYLVIENFGTAADQLVGAAADVADAVELHQTKEEGGMMKMSPVDAVEVPVGARTELRPGGYHIMLIGLKEPLTTGQTFPLTLQFQNAGDVQVTATVREQ